MVPACSHTVHCTWSYYMGFINMLAQIPAADATAAVIHHISAVHDSHMKRLQFPLLCTMLEKQYHQNVWRSWTSSEILDHSPYLELHSTLQLVMSVDPGQYGRVLIHTSRNRSTSGRHLYKRGLPLSLKSTDRHRSGLLNHPAHISLAQGQLRQHGHLLFSRSRRIFKYLYSTRQSFWGCVTSPVEYADATDADMKRLRSLLRELKTDGRAGHCHTGNQGLHRGQLCQ